MTHAAHKVANKLLDLLPKYVYPSVRKVTLRLCVLSCSWHRPVIPVICPHGKLFKVELACVWMGSEGGDSGSSLNPRTNQQGWLAKFNFGLI